MGVNSNVMPDLRLFPMLLVNVISSFSGTMGDEGVPLYVVE
jgi:hypothetical protein